MPEQRPSGLSPLRYPVFRAVWGASTLSSLGGVIQTVGASWMMLTISQSATMVALVQASVALPVVLLALAAGAVADIVDRRKLMLAAQVFMLLVSIALAACAWAGVITPWLLLMFTFLIGCGAAFTAPAWQASVGDMLPRAEMTGAVVLNAMSFNIARSVGPAIGGLIVAGVGAAATFGVNAVSYLPLIVVLALWRPAPIQRLLPPESLGIAVAAGVRYVAMSPAIHAVLARCAALGIGASAILALMPLIAKHTVGGGPLAFGMLLGAFGLGAVAGAFASARLRERWSAETIVRIAAVGLALAAAIAGVSSLLLVTLAAMLVAGAGWVLAMSTFNVTVQLSAPRWVVARALSIYQMVVFGAIAAGSWLWGVVAADHGTRTALLAAAIVMFVAAALGRWLPLSQVDLLNLDPLRQWNAPETAVPIEPRSGPVVITIEYIIRPEDTLEFLAAMSERRRIRRRDGAYNWRLLRDLADPRVWFERYETPTWLDYIRLNNRLTQDDAVVPQRLRALHSGTEAPRVHRMIERQPGSLPTGQAATTAELGEALSVPMHSP